MSISAVPGCHQGVNKKFKKMETRVNIFEKGENGMKALFGIGGYLRKSTIERSLMELISFRTSQTEWLRVLSRHARQRRPCCW